LRHRLLGWLGEATLEARLEQLGETDMLHWTASFGAIFRMFFRPSQAIQRKLDRIQQELGLVSGKYSAVHCRVRHPKALEMGKAHKGKNDHFFADKSGLPWHGDAKQFAVEHAVHAISCARNLLNDLQEPMYFFADSNDLVHYMAHELANETFVEQNVALLSNASSLDTRALKLVQTSTVVAREVTEENAHIDKQKGRRPPAYYATFLDLLLAASARCVTYGVGYYAYFAAKISGTSRRQLYREEAWGQTADKQAKVCKLNWA
jgi:hypothetical protein